MHASVIETTFKAENRDEAIALTSELVDELSTRVEGLRGFVLLDRGDNRSTAMVLYESKEQWEAAAPVAQEILGKLGPFMADMPERTGCDVILAKRYIID